MKRGIVRINAGAGAGKTLVVVMRVIRLLMSGVKPEEILLITFTNTGAAEMRDRIKLYADDFGIEADISKIMIWTFNAFGDMILKENFEKFGFSKPPKVADNIDRTQIINDLLSEEPRIKGLDYRHYSMKNKYVYGALPMVQEIFSIQKTKMYDSTDAPKVVSKIGAKISLSACEEVMELYDKYGTYLENVVSFTFEGSAGVQKMDSIMKFFRESEDFMGKKIISRLDYLEQDELPKSNIMEFVFEDEENGIWRYASDTLWIEIHRQVQAKPKRVWYEAEVRCAEGSTGPRMIANDPEHWKTATEYPYKTHNSRKFQFSRNRSDKMNKIFKT